MRRHEGGTGRGARGRVSQSPHPGGPGAPPGGHYELPARSWLTTEAEILRRKRGPGNVTDAATARRKARRLSKSRKL